MIALSMTCPMTTCSKSCLMTSWIPFWRTSTIAVELCEKVLFIMDDVVNDMNKMVLTFWGATGCR